ncbi:MAG TPA: proton extrusion protein PcxA [Nostocaceae cyanobacterium]|nr:proton extrusion protein PcxA [Nostocaceae cyanobacterium]
MSVMKDSSFNRKTGKTRQMIKYWQFFSKRIVETPERALLEAYQAAQEIRKIEIEKFGGQKITTASANFSENIMAYWRGNLNRNLAIIKIKLAEFQVSRALLNKSQSGFLEKLAFIDEVVGKYKSNLDLINNHREYDHIIDINHHAVNQEPNPSNVDPLKETASSNQNGLFPSSIGRTFDRISRDFIPQAEEDFVKNYRISRNRTKRAIRFLLLLIIIPVLTQHFSKQFIIYPIVNRVNTGSNAIIFLNRDIEGEAIKELRIYEQKVRFQHLLYSAPEINSLEITETERKEKAREIAQEFHQHSNSAISNFFADIISLIAFGLVIVTSKKEIVTVKYFMDELVYGLSDSAKAFLIILFTDIFVGFHSPHGWEIILEDFAAHLGLPASRNAIFLFIATFPVILNTIFKYWIFRYLSRLSPSALATLKEMDE